MQHCLQQRFDSKNSILKMYKIHLRNVWFQKISIPPPWRVTGNSEEEGVRPKYLTESMSLNWNFQRVGGSDQKDPLWGEYGYFMKQHNARRESTSFRAHLIQQFNHSFSLFLSPHFDWRATPNLLILFLNFWSSPSCNPNSHFTVTMNSGRILSINN